MHDRSRLKYLYIVFALILFVIYLVLASSFFRQNRTSQAQQEKLSASPSPTFVPKQGKMQQILKERDELTLSEEQIKTRLLAPLSKQTGLIHKETDFTVYYLAETDSFQIRLFGSNLEDSKQRALEWFSDQGFSKLSLCNLVLDFHLTPQQQQNLKEPFSPFPQGCYE